MAAGPEFGSEDGKKILVIKSLFGLKRSCAEFSAFLAETLYEMCYMPSYTDLDLWLRPEVNPDSFGYYEYILCYVDNMLCISHNPRKSMKRIWEYFNIKDYKI